MKQLTCPALACGLALLATPALASECPSKWSGYQTHSAPELQQREVTIRKVIPAPEYSIEMKKDRGQMVRSTLTGAALGTLLASAYRYHHPDDLWVGAAVGGAIGLATVEKQPTEVRRERVMLEILDTHISPTQTVWVEVAASPRHYRTGYAYARIQFDGHCTYEYEVLANR